MQNTHTHTHIQEHFIPKSVGALIVAMFTSYKDGRVPVFSTWMLVTVCIY